GRDVHRDDRTAARVDPVDHPRRILARRIAEPDPEERVDDHVGRAQVAEPVDDLNLTARLAENACADLAVAAVVAFAAHDRHAPGELVQHDPGDGGARPLHELLPRTSISFHVKYTPEPSAFPTASFAAKRPA